MEQASPVPVDVADVTVLVDTFVDVLLASTEPARRATLAYEWSEQDQLRAEHGFALLLAVQRGGKTQSILYDAGLGRDTAVHNMDVLEIRPTDLRAVVLSHGHADHHTGLEGMFRRLGRPGMPLVLHPDAWRDRRIVFPTGTEIHAFVGGLHLTGGLFEPIIPQTITQLVAIGPDWVVPGHCTGWRATHDLARALPEGYVQISVGTTMHFAGV